MTDFHGVERKRTNKIGRSLLLIQSSLLLLTTKTPFRQGVEEDGHIWWEICECETCYWNAQETEWELQMEREENRIPSC